MTDSHTPHRNVRVSDDRWKPFGEAFGDRNRSAWLVELIDALNADPQLWKDVKAIAEARGESIEQVVNTALRQYAKRHQRHLHAVPADD